MSDSGMRITKFEKSTFGTPKNNFLGHLGVQPETAGQLTYTFTRAFPLSIASMPVSYDQSNLLKCTVSMSYVRYVVDGSNPPVIPGLSSGGQSDLATATDISFDERTQADVNQAVNAGTLTGERMSINSSKTCWQEQARLIV